MNAALANGSDALANGVEALIAGGPVVAILVAMSVLASAVCLFKLMHLRLSGIGDHRTTRAAVSAAVAGDASAARSIADGARSPAARIVGDVLDADARGLPRDLIREEAARRARDAVEDASTWLRPLEVIATLAPLLGLFGTVLGMIEAFQALETAGNRVDPAILSGGIWQALLTTALGLAVAIPTVAVLNWLERRIERFAAMMDSELTRLFTNDLNHEGRINGRPDVTTDKRRTRSLAAE